MNLFVPFICIFSGILGGCVHYLSWIILVGMNGDKNQTGQSKSARNRRMSVMVASVMIGGVSGLMVWLWFLDEINSGSVNKVLVFCFWAGLSGVFTCKGVGEKLVRFIL